MAPKSNPSAIRSIRSIALLALIPILVILNLTNSKILIRKSSFSIERIFLSSTPNRQLPSISSRDYTKEQAAQAIRPTEWTCGDDEDDDDDDYRITTKSETTKQKPILSYVHVFKAGGSTMRTFFRDYASTCKKNWMLLVACSGVDSSTLKSGVSGNGVEVNWKPCTVKAALDTRDRFFEDKETPEEERVYPTVNNTVLRENVDIFIGHFRIGTGDYIFPKSTNSHPDSTSSHQMPTIHEFDPQPVRYVVFLRDPMTRLVSGYLYNKIKHNKGELKSIEHAAEEIKKLVYKARKTGYWGGSLKYLLTPEQAETYPIVENRTALATKVEETQVEFATEEKLAKFKANLAIENLAKYNVIMGMIERMPQSMAILEHVLSANVPSKSRKKKLRRLFERESESKSMKNVQKQGDISTSTVLKELKKDEAFMSELNEYLKYENMVNEFAWKMHSMQYQLVEDAAAKKNITLVDSIE